MILTEPARATGARRDIGIFLADHFGTDACPLAAKKLRQVAGHEAGGTALADIGELAAKQKIIACRLRQWASAIA